MLISVVGVLAHRKLCAKGKGIDLYIASTRSVCKAFRYSTRCHLHTLRFIRKRNEPYPAFSFPAAAGTHLPTPEGRKAE